MYYTHLDTPIGPLLIAGDPEAIHCIAFSEARRGRSASDVDPDWVRAPGKLREATSQLRAYFSGKLKHFDVPVTPAGTPFQRQVWTELQAIPYGERLSYGELARRIGKPTASRAVGAANGRNPIPIVIPCHRVVGSSGKLTGFAGGLDTKRALLDLESR
jgi:methylated-DNA-[protein]-cysteine S-methyltransferase